MTLFRGLGVVADALKDAVEKVMAVVFDAWTYEAWLASLARRLMDLVNKDKPYISMPGVQKRFESLLKKVEYLINNPVGSLPPVTKPTGLSNKQKSEWLDELEKKAQEILECKSIGVVLGELNRMRFPKEPGGLGGDGVLRTISPKLHRPDQLRSHVVGDVVVGPILTPIRPSRSIRDTGYALPVRTRSPFYDPRAYPYE